MNPVVAVLVLACAFIIGIWLGWYAAHLDIRFESDLAEYLSTGSLPALSFGDSAGQGAGPHRTPQRWCGPRIPRPNKLKARRGRNPRRATQPTELKENRVEQQ